MIPMARPLVGEEEKRAVLEVLESGMLAQGKKVDEFEKAFAEFIGVKHAIATSNGTTALHTAILAHKIGEGDEVITTPFSFIATANVIQMSGATPVFVDIEEGTFNLDPAKIEQAITPRTRAIMPVHLYGKPVLMHAICDIARKHDLIVIEDACQAHGAEINGRRVGSFGTGCFSFYPTKNMTTGEGGIITTNDDSFASLARKMISHGSSKRYHNEFVGYNYRMTNIAAAIGIEQLKKLERFTQKRQHNAKYLSNGLSQIPGITTPSLSSGHVFHQYSIRITSDFGKSREQVVEFLKMKGIQSSIFYPIPIHKQEAYPRHNSANFPAAEKAAKEILSIPVHPSLDKEDLDIIIRALKACGE